LPGIGAKLAKLLSTYGSPKDSNEHASLADEIKQAVIRRNSEELLMNIEYFGNARNNETGTPRMQMVEMFCYKEAKAIISELTALGQIPWEELSKALNLSTVSPYKNLPVFVSHGPSKEELVRAEDFITRFVLHNDGLTPDAKEMLVNKARSERGPWVAEGEEHIQDVTQNGRKITVKHKSGEAFYNIK